MRTHPTEIPFKKIQHSCSCSFFTSAYLGFELCSIFPPFKSQHIAVLQTPNPAQPNTTIQPGRNSHNGIERRNGTWMRMRMKCRKISYRFPSEGFSSHSLPDEVGVSGRKTRGARAMYFRADRMS
jgi:hypothetical protein